MVYLTSDMNSSQNSLWLRFMLPKHYLFHFLLRNIVSISLAAAMCSATYSQLPLCRQVLKFKQNNFKRDLGEKESILLAGPLFARLFLHLSARNSNVMVEATIDGHLLTMKQP